MGTAHGLAILNGLQRFPASSGFTCFPHRHGASTVDYVLAQPSFIPSIQDFKVGPRPIEVAVDHALLTFTVSFQFSTARVAQTSTHTRYTFTSETDPVYIDGIYRRLVTEEPGRSLEELTQILTETLHDAAAETYPHTQPTHRRRSGSMPQNIGMMRSVERREPDFRERCFWESLLIDSHRLPSGAYCDGRRGLILLS